MNLFWFFDFKRYLNPIVRTVFRHAITTSHCAASWRGYYRHTGERLHGYRR